jgi:hypothetical protein
MKYELFKRLVNSGYTVLESDEIVNSNTVSYWLASGYEASELAQELLSRLRYLIEFTNDESDLFVPLSANFVLVRSY